MKLSKNSRYIDDIAVVNFLEFSVISREIYDPSLTLEGSTSGYHYDTFLDLQIRIFQNRFIIGIYHKVDDFNFEVINFPFLESNICSRIGYTTFYSQLVRFFRLCNNLTDFLARVNLIYYKLLNRGYSNKLLYKYFFKFASNYPVCLKYNIRDVKVLWSTSLGNSFASSCNISDMKSISEIVKPCKILVKDNHPKDNFKHKVITKPLTKSTVTIKNDLPLVENLYEHRKPHILNNPSNHCYVNSILQALFRIFIDSSQTINHKENPEGKLINKFLECIKSNSLSLDNFKRDLAGYNSFFDGRIQRDAYECLILLLDIFHIGTRVSILEGGDDLEIDEDMYTSLTKELFNSTNKVSYKCKNCEYTSHKFSETRVYFVDPKPNENITNLLMTSFDNDVHKLCTICNIDTLHEEKIKIEIPPKNLVILINRFDSSNSNRKNNITIEIDKWISLFKKRYVLQATIEHRGIYSNQGHYVTYLFFDNTIFLCNDSQINDIEFKNKSNLVYMLFYSLIT